MRARSVTRSRCEYLGHDDKLIAWKLELLDRVAQDDLGKTIGIDLSATSLFPRHYPTVTNQLTLAVSKVVMPWSHLASAANKREFAQAAKCAALTQT